MGARSRTGNTNDMIFDVPSIIEFLSGSTTLLPGTTILTGTPHGVGMAANPPRWLEAGRHRSIEIERIGGLTNSVQFEPGFNPLWNLACQIVVAAVLWVEGVVSTARSSHDTGPLTDPLHPNGRSAMVRGDSGNRRRGEESYRSGNMPAAKSSQLKQVQLRDSLSKEESRRR